jgi:hypothetical protein
MFSLARRQPLDLNSQDLSVSSYLVLCSLLAPRALWSLEPDFVRHRYSSVPVSTERAAAVTTAGTHDVKVSLESSTTRNIRQLTINGTNVDSSEDEYAYVVLDQGANSTFLAAGNYASPVHEDTVPCCLGPGLPISF